MADSDGRLEAMEDELRLVKGEIKRTLVDLRAAVMQADSPFQRIIAAPAENAQAVKQVVVQREQIAQGDSVAQAPAAPQTAAPDPQQPQQAAGHPVQGVQPGPGGQSPQTWPNGDPDPDAGAVYDRADEHENGGGGRQRRSREFENEVADPEELRGRRSGRAPRASLSGRSNGRHGAAESEFVSDRGRGGSRDEDRNGKVRSRLDANGYRRDRLPGVEEDEWELAGHDEDDVLHGLEDPSRGARPALNVNLISGLVRWVSTVQDRLGDTGMEEMVDLYFKTTRESAGTRELISRIADTLAYAETPRVDPRSEQGIAEQWTDMLIQLHGVLNWDCVPPDIPGLGLGEPGEDEPPRIRGR